MTRLTRREEEAILDALARTLAEGELAGYEDDPAGEARLLAAMVSAQAKLWARHADRQAGGSPR